MGQKPSLRVGARRPEKKVEAGERSRLSYTSMTDGRTAEAELLYLECIRSN